MSLVDETKIRFENRLAEIDDEIEKKVGPLQAERDELRRVLAAMEGRPMRNARPSGTRRARATAEEMEARKGQVRGLLGEHADMSVRQLAELCGLSYPTAMQTVKRMQDEGELEKTKDGWKVSG